MRKTFVDCGFFQSGRLEGRGWAVYRDDYGFTITIEDQNGIYSIDWCGHLDSMRKTVDVIDAIEEMK